MRMHVRCVREEGGKGAQKHSRCLRYSDVSPAAHVSNLMTVYRKHLQRTVTQVDAAILPRVFRKL